VVRSHFSRHLYSTWDLIIEARTLNYVKKTEFTFTTSSITFEAASFYVISGMRFEPNIFKPQLVGGRLFFFPCLYLVIYSTAKVPGCCRCWRECLGWTQELLELVMATENELQRLLTFLFSMEFSDYSATIALKLSLHYFLGWYIWNLPLCLNR